MITAPQGFFTYPGLIGCKSAEYVYSRGISPGVVSITCAPSLGLKNSGSATFEYAGAFVTLANCIVNGIDRNVENGEVWRVTLLDARWEWQHGAIEGQYNVKLGGKILASSEKSSRELATILLNAMPNVNGFNVTALPDDDTPYVEWNSVEPAKALADLCDLSGCFVVWHPNGFVRIHKMGVGNPLPQGALWVNDGIEPKVIPREVIVKTAPTQWQVDLPLKPMARNVAKELVPIDDVVYKPLGDGWTYENEYDFGGVQVEFRGLARDSVWRIYRVDVSNFDVNDPPFWPALPNDGPDDIPDLDELSQILPLGSSQVESETDDVERSLPVWIWGIYAMSGPGAVNTVNYTPGLPEKPKIRTDDAKFRYEKSFRVAPETGHVYFSDPVFYNDQLSQGKDKPRIYLRVAISIRDKDSRAPLRYSKSYTIPFGVQGVKKVVQRDDLQLRYWYDPEDEEWKSNLNDIKDKLDLAAQAERDNFVQTAPQTGFYAGIVPVLLDGLISQVTLSISDRGTTTTISRMTEHDFSGITYKERRRLEKIARALNDTANGKLAEAEKVK